ncbi:MAG TPA: hypothetical protein VIX59_15845 [Candidatus Binataceae bacterium]|jgi:hypothetical protein
MKRFTAVTIALAAVLAAALPAFAQDDWQVIERHDNTGASGAGAKVPQPKADAKLVVACGENAHPATEPYKSIVSQLNDLYGTSFPVYESVRVMSPHASSGGCIFYNRDFLASLMGNWMKIDDPSAAQPMLYAIFAHELGHLSHDDFSSRNQGGPPKNRELAADQFAGYTVERLGVRRLDPDEVTKYYQLTGDDFTGGASGHGTGDERTNAFLDGWHRAEVGLPESSGRPAGGMGEP